MKKLQLMALAILFAIAGTSFVEAKKKHHKKSCNGRVKSDCKGSCGWRNGKCRHKVKKAKVLVPQQVQNNDSYDDSYDDSQD